jgi:hypothetical protein
VSQARVLGKSKSAVLKRIVATDKEMRSKAVKIAGELMSKAAKAEATAAGWTTGGSTDDGYPSTGRRLD